ncbi:MAG: O-antigen ligase family protein [Chloroflexota bacterium]
MRTLTYWLSVALVFTIPFKELLVLPEVGSLSLLLGLAVAGCWVVAVTYSGVIRPVGIFHLAAFGFFLWNFLSILWSIDADDSMARALTYARMALFIWMIWDLYDSRGKIWSAAQAYVLGAWINLGSVLYNFLNGIEAYRFAHGRFTATGFNTNETGLLLALGLPLAWYLIISKPLGERVPLVLRWLNFLYLPVGLFGIVLTASRGSMLATLPVFIAVLLTLPETHRAQRRLFILGIVIAGIAMFNLVPDESLQRLGTTGEEISANDLNGRVDVWEDGFEIFTENMLIGTGANTFRKAVDSGKAPHNVFMAIAVDVGLIGLTLFILVLSIVFFSLLRYPFLEQMIWLVLVLAWLTGSMVGNWEYENVSWLFLCLIVRGASLRVHIQSSTNERHPPLAKMPLASAK